MNTNKYKFLTKSHNDHNALVHYFTNSFHFNYLRYDTSIDVIAYFVQSNIGDTDERLIQQKIKTMIRSIDCKLKYSTFISSTPQHTEIQLCILGSNGQWTDKLYNQVYDKLHSIIGECKRGK